MNFPRNNHQIHLVRGCSWIFQRARTLSAASASALCAPGPRDAIKQEKAWSNLKLRAIFAHWNVWNALFSYGSIRMFLYPSFASLDFDFLVTHGKVRAVKSEPTCNKHNSLVALLSLSSSKNLPMFCWLIHGDLTNQMIVNEILLIFYVQFIGILPFSRPHHQRQKMALAVVQPSCCQPNRLWRSERPASDGLIPAPAFHFKTTEGCSTGRRLGLRTHWLQPQWASTNMANWKCCILYIYGKNI